MNALTNHFNFLDVAVYIKEGPEWQGSVHVHQGGRLVVVPRVLHLSCKTENKLMNQSTVAFWVFEVNLF